MLQSVGSKHCFSCPWEVVGDVTQPVVSLTLVEELAWSASRLPAVGSTAPLLTGGEPSWCCCALQDGCC